MAKKHSLSGFGNTAGLHGITKTAQLLQSVLVAPFTHNEQLAGYGNRIIELVDGKVEADYAPEAVS